MTDNAAPSREIKLSPFGPSRYNHLNRPDEYNGVERYKTQLVLTGKDRDEFKAMIDKLAEEAKEAALEKLSKGTAKEKAQAKAGIGIIVPYEEILDDETGDSTGDIAFKFSMNKTITLKDGEVITRKPVIVAADRKPIENPPLIYGGSVIRVAYTTRTYYNAAAKAAGVTLDLHKVQIKTLAQRTRPTTDSTFDEVEGGWTGETDRPELDEDMPF